MMPMSIRSNAVSAACVISIAALLAGCSTVTTQNPLSAEHKPIDKDKFEGVWLLDKEAVSLRFTSNGTARIAGVEWKDDQFRLVQGEMIVTKGKKFNFLSVRFQEDGKWMDHYCFLQYDFTDQGDLLLWLPNDDVFEEAIKTNRLHGVVKKEMYSTDITITNALGILLEFIDNPENPSLFNYREPIVLRRIAGQEKAEQLTAGDKK